MMQPQMKQDQEIVASWAEKKMGSCKVALSAKDLSIVWGSDRRYWKMVQEPDQNNGDQTLDVSELIEVCWLQIDGKYNVRNLEHGRYEVYFIVKLKEHLGMNQVNLKLTRPDGRPQVNKEQLMNKPKNTWIELKVGEFTINRTWDKNVKFSMNGCDGTTWKTGLTVIGAVIVPVCQ